MTRTDALVLALFACLAIARAEEQKSATRAPIALSAVRTWCYQIQNIEALAKSSYDLLVIEPTRTVAASDENSRFDTHGAVAKLKASLAGDGAHRKLVIAYVSVGEAEDWRWYWTWSREQGGKNAKRKKNAPLPADWPSFIVGRDPDGWSGCCPVALWNSEWKDIVIYGKNHSATPERDYNSIIDETLKDGFDGVYLDWVGAYEDDRRVVAAAKSAGLDAAKSAGLDAAKETVALIREIREYGRRRNPDFLVIQQNAASLIERDPSVAQAVDAVGQEDTWYLGGSDKDWDDPKGYDKPQKPGDTKETIRLLQLYQRAGKKVLTIDYTVAHAGEVCVEARRLGFIPYCSRTSLDRLTTTPPQ